MFVFDIILILLFYFSEMVQNLVKVLALAVWKSWTWFEKVKSS